MTSSWTGILAWYTLTYLLMIDTNLTSIVSWFTHYNKHQELPYNLGARQPGCGDATVPSLKQEFQGM